MTPEIHELKMAAVIIVGMFGVAWTVFGLVYATDEAANRRRERDLDELPPAEYAKHVQRRTK